jgi:hypothetical protein
MRERGGSGLWWPRVARAARAVAGRRERAAGRREQLNKSTRRRRRHRPHHPHQSSQLLWQRVRVHVLLPRLFPRHLHLHLPPRQRRLRPRPRRRRGVGDSRRGCRGRAPPGRRVAAADSPSGRVDDQPDHAPPLFPGPRQSLLRGERGEEGGWRPWGGVGGLEPARPTPPPAPTPRPTRPPTASCGATPASASRTKSTCSSGRARSSS